MLLITGGLWGCAHFLTGRNPNRRPRHETRPAADEPRGSDYTRTPDGGELGEGLSALAALARAAARRRLI